MEKKRLVNFRLPESLLEKIDAKAKNKTEYIVDLIEKDLFPDKEKSLHNILKYKALQKAKEESDEFMNKKINMMDKKVIDICNEFTRLKEEIAGYFEKTDREFRAVTSLLYSKMDKLQKEVKDIKDRYQVKERDFSLMPW